MKQKILVGVLAGLLSGVVFADEETRILQLENVESSEITIKQTGGDNKLVASQQGNTFGSTITATIDGSNNDSGNRYTEFNLLSQINADSSDMTANVGGDNNSFIVGQNNVAASSVDMDISGDYNRVLAQQQITDFSRLNIDISGGNNQLAALQVGDYKAEANNLTANIDVRGRSGAVNLCQGDAERCETFAQNNFNTGTAIGARYNRAIGEGAARAAAAIAGAGSTAADNLPGPDSDPSPYGFFNHPEDYI